MLFSSQDVARRYRQILSFIFSDKEFRQTLPIYVPHLSQKKTARRSRQILSVVFFWTKSAWIYAVLFSSQDVARRSRQILSFIFSDKEFRQTLPGSMRHICQ